MRWLGARAAVLALAGWAAPAVAQIPYRVFDENTQVASIDFRFSGTRSFPTSALAEQLALRPRGRLAGVREALAFLPFIEAPEPHPFSPLELQRDVARLRAVYEREGFIGTRVSYEVHYDNAKNRVDVDFLIAEGRPIVLRSLTMTLPDGGDPIAQIPPELHDEWRTMTPQKLASLERRLTESERTRILGVVLDWWKDRGWAFTHATAVPEVDSANASIALRVTIDPGPRARVDSIDVLGNRSVSRGLVLRTIPLKRGDWFSAARLTEGQRRLFGLQLFRVALTEVPAQARDSTVTPRIRLEEAEPRLLTAEAGYLSAGGGATIRSEFTHRNFTGGARTLTISTVAQTGWMSLDPLPEVLYQGSVAFHEPLFVDPRLSFTIAPFGLYRDNLTDRSQQFGVETSFIYSLGSFRFLTLQHRYAAKRVFDYRFGSGSTIGLDALLALAAEGTLDNISAYVKRSTLGVSGSFGRLDPTRRIAAFQVRPSIEVATPPALNEIEYGLFELPMVAIKPISRRVSVAAHGRIGRVVPFGKTITDDTIGVLNGIRLRDVLLNTGGSGTVRGWRNGLLGPKQLNLQFRNVPGTDSLVAAGTDGYIPGGGLARADFGVELRLPFPGLSDAWGTHAFLEGGRVWTSDVLVQSDVNNEERWFFGAGGGLDLRTLVGPVRLSVGYKLNPSPLDVRDPDRVFEAFAQGLPVTSVPANPRMRYHVHLTIGQVF